MRARRAAAVAACVATAVVAAAPAQAAAPSRLLVQAREFRFMLSRTAVAAGPAVVQMVVNGEDPHDLRIVRLDARGRAAGAARGIAEVLPGATGEWSGRLVRGRYKLFCSLPGHERAGMRAVLRVR